MQFAVILCLTSDIHFFILFSSTCLSTRFANQILDLLIPEEDADLNDLVLEVTAGVGGQEAMLFTAEVWRKLCFVILEYKVIL